MARSDRRALALLALAAALGAPSVAGAGAPDPTGDVLFASPWRESVAKVLAAMRPAAAPPAAGASVFGTADDGDVAAARIKVRASISSQPKVNLSLPLARLSGGAGGIELSGQARSPRAGLTATALAERTLWSAGAEAWHDIGPVTAYAGTAIAREWDAFEGPHRTRNTYGGIEWEGAGLWGLEHGTWRSALEGRDERETRLSWRHRIARGWSAGVEATEIRGDGWRDRRIGLALRGAL